MTLNFQIYLILIALRNFKFTGILIATILLTTAFMVEDFKALQLKYDRVQTAYDQKSEAVFALLASKHLHPSQLELYFRAIKNEKTLEIWAKNRTDETFQHVKDYVFAGYCGSLGPKRKEGDMQIPEGFYHINRFNPMSSFYLSLGLNYPNESDRILGHKSKPGSDIFIHGTNITSRCIPITDEKIKEVYILAIEAKNAGQEKIPVDIFPARLDEKSFEELKAYSKSPEYIEYWRPWLGNKVINSDAMNLFWAQLKPRYQYFETHRQLKSFKVNEKGKYVY